MIRCVGLGPRLDFKYLNIEGKADEKVKTLFMQEIVRRGVYFVWNMLPSFKITDEEIDFTLNVFDEALKVTVDAEKQDKVSEMLQGEVPVKVI